MLKRLVLVISCTVLPAVASAQHAAPEIAAPRADAGVTLTVGSHLAPSARGELGIPLPLLERLAAEAALLSVDTAPVGGRVVMQVRFTFPDIAALQRWYSDERSARMIADLRAISIWGSFETYVSYRRAAHP